MYALGTISSCFIIVKLDNYFRYVNPRFDFKWVDSQTTVDVSIKIGCIGHVWVTVKEVEKFLMEASQKELWEHVNMKYDYRFYWLIWKIIHLTIH